MYAMSTFNSVHATGEESDPAGSGSKLGKAAIIVAGVAALVACLISFLSIWLQLKSESSIPDLSNAD